MRDVPLGKLSVSESKIILVYWTSFFSMKRQIFTLLATWTNRICAVGLKLSLMISGSQPFR